MTQLDLYRAHGPDRLPPQELLGLAIGDAPAAAALLDRYGSLRAVARAPIEALSLDLGPRRGLRLHAALALAQRAETEPPPPMIDGAEAAARLFVPRLAGLQQEELHGAFLDHAARVRRVAVISRGTDAYTVMEARTILRLALEVGSASMLLAHNHPSGDAEPSAQDLQATRAVARAAEVVGLRLVDHLIVAGRRWASMAARGEIPS